MFADEEKYNNANADQCEMGNIVKTKQKDPALIERDTSLISKKPTYLEKTTSNLSETTNQSNVEVKKKFEIETFSIGRKFHLERNDAKSDVAKTKDQTRPYFLVGLEDMIIPEGCTVALECCVHTPASGEISWYKDESLITHGTNGYVIEKEESGWNRLIIPAAR